MQKLVLSASSVNTFLRCGQQWYLLYVAGIRQRPRLRAIRGIAIHKAVEHDMEQKIESYEDLPLAEVLDAYDTSWNRETEDGWENDPLDEPGQTKDAGYALVEKYLTEVAPTIQPSIVEKSVQFEINGFAYSGQIDIGQHVWDKETRESRLIIRDTKSTKRTPKPDQYDLNMTGYALSQRQETGKVEADIVLDYLIDQKVPKYLKVSSGGPVTDEQIRRFSSTVTAVGNTIQAGSFVPNGIVSGACSWCGVRDWCDAYKKEG